MGNANQSVTFESWYFNPSFYSVSTLLIQNKSTIKLSSQSVIIFNMKNLTVTKKGYELLKKAKSFFKYSRPAVVNAILSREHGDLKNAEYRTIKEQQGFIEGRIQDLNAKLAKANVIDIEKLSGIKSYLEQR